MVLNNLNGKSAQVNSTSNGQVIMPPAVTDKSMWTWGAVPKDKYFVLRTTLSPKGLAQAMQDMADKTGGKLANVHNGSLLWGRQFRQDGGTDYTVRVNILPMVRKDGATVFDENGLPKFVDSSMGINLSANKGFSIEDLDPATKAAIEATLGGMKLEAAMQIDSLRNLVLPMLSEKNAEKRVDTKKWLMTLLGVRTESQLVPSQLKVVLPRSLDFSEAFTDEVLGRVADENKSAVVEIYIPLVAEARNKDMVAAKIKKGDTTYDVMDPDDNQVMEAQFTWGTQNIPVEGIVVKFGKSLGGVDTSRMYSSEYITKSLKDIWAIQNRVWVGAEVTLAEERIESFFTPNGNKWHLKAGLLPANGETTCEYWEATDTELPLWEKYMAKALGNKKVPFEWADRKVQSFNQQMMELLMVCRKERSRTPWEEFCRGCGINKVGTLVPSAPVVVEPTPEAIVSSVETPSIKEEVKAPEVKQEEVVPVVQDEFVDELVQEESVSMDDFMNSFDDMFNDVI